MLELILDVRKRGLPIVLISHNMPHVFEVADRIHIHRLGRRLCVIDPKEYHDVRCGRLHDRRQEAAGRGAGGLSSTLIVIFKVNARAYCLGRFALKNCAFRSHCAVQRRKSI